MFAAIDIGNTTITTAIYDNNCFVEIFKFKSDKLITEQEYEKLFKTIVNKYKIDSCTIVSVVKELDYLINTVADKIFCVNSKLINSISGTNIKVLIDNPQELGADRIANVYGAINQYPLPAIIIDIGTATTFDIILADGSLAGGLIMPGVNMQLKSLHLNTSKLPQISIQQSPVAVAKSTKDAILSGVIRGCACAIDGLIEQCEKELGEKCTIITTGGDSKLISMYMKRKIDYINPYLTLEGICKI